MTKTNFMQGAFIATLGIVISKILGILYVIPFYQIIGEQGGALYGYAYNIYAIFLGISTAGLPLAISKIISEYHTLGYENAKEESFKLGKQISVGLGILCFVVLFIFAPQVARLIIGDIQGGNTIDDVTLVIRVISTAVLVVPALSVYRGYFQGHNFMTPTSISQVLEQVVRVLIIVIGSFMALKVFHLSLKTSVGIAVFGASAGALISCLYLIVKLRKNKKQFDKEKEAAKVVEPVISKKEIAMKLLMYCFPFIMIDIFKSLYNSVDMVTLVKTLVNGLGYTAMDAESVMSIISTWGSKFNMIVMAIASGCMVSLIPNLTASFVENKMDDVRHKINQTFQILLLVTVPMTVGISILAKPIWMVFYGNSTFGSSVIAYYIFVALATAAFTSSITIVQLLKDYKIVFISLFSGLFTKILLNIPLIYGFSKIGVPAYYGAITGSILGYLVSTAISLVYLHYKYQVNYEDTVKQGLNILTATITMVIALLLIGYILPTSFASRLLNIPLIIFYGLIGCVIYITITWRSKTIEHILGMDFINKIMSKIPIIKDKKRGRRI